MKTHIRKLSEKSLAIINQTKSYPDKKVIEGYHIVGSNRSLFSEKPLYIFLEIGTGGGYNIRFGGWEIKECLKRKSKLKITPTLLNIVSSYAPPEKQERQLREALKDLELKLAWSLIRGLWEKIKSRGN